MGRHCGFEWFEAEFLNPGQSQEVASRPEEKFPISESYLEAGVVCSLSWCKTNLTRVYGRDTYG